MNTLPQYESATTRAPQPERPKLLIGVVVAAVVFGIVATVLGVANAVAIGNESDEREEDRIGADLASCRRGNILRTDLIDTASAAGVLTADSVAAVLRELGADEDRIASALEAMGPAIEAHRATIDEIELVDCAAVTPGVHTSRPTTTTEPPP